MNKKPFKKASLHERDKVEGFSDSFNSIGTDVVDSVAQTGKDTMNDLWMQFFGAEKTGKKQGDELQQGQEFTVSDSNQKASEDNEKEYQKQYIEPGLNYKSEILHGEQKISKEEEQAEKYRIEELMNEIKKLVSTSAQLEVQFKQVTNSQRIVRTGKYHVGFFNFVLGLVRQAQRKVDSSRAFLATVHGKKKQRGYWNMFEQHGTSFGMSNERNVATQTG